MRRHHHDALAIVLASLCVAMAAAADPLVPTIIDCSACDVPVPTEIPFCASFVKYSSCRTAASWKTMDHAARAEFTSLGALPAPSCATSLQRAVCTKHFNRIALGVADGGKCFDVDYEGPQRTAWVIGFSIAVVFSFLASVGINLQKRALKQNETYAHENNVEPRPAYRLPLWVLGFVLILAGSILDFVAFGLAPQSLLAPLAALTLVWNMMLAPCFNKEKLSKKDIVATLIIFAGATIAVVFASHSSPSYNLSMLMHLYKDPLTSYWIISGVLGGVIYFQEIRSFSVEQACMFVLGIMTTIFGAIQSSIRQPCT
ncbi:hypothetical protein ATCC90586_004498 [Pythium insidiosum]|nr:hypothetical protein ATCC90586_004498 [Pythium insidiosum]